MPSDRSVLERQIERVELRPFTLDGFHRRRQRKQRNRRIATGAVALAVAAAGIGGVARVFLSGSGTRPADQPSSRFMGEELAGVWLQTRAVEPAPHKVLTFTTDGTFVMEAADRDAYGAVDGTYQVQGDTITFTDPERGCPLMKWTGRHPGGGEAVPDAVDFEFTITDTGAGDCTAPSGFHVEGMRLDFVRISPRSPETDDWELESEFRSSQQADQTPSLRLLAGIWSQDDGEHVLRISPGGEYTIGVGEALVTGPANTGTISIGDEGTIEFTSGPESRTCVEGALHTWRDVRVDRNGMFADDVAGDPCGGLPVGPISWHNLIRY